MSQTSHSGNARNVVLVHGGWVDGSGWEGVYKALKKSGYAVTIVQEATTSLADDVAATKRAIASQNGPVILVGHSYGGAVITEAGNDPKVAGLVYIAAFGIDEGESLGALLSAPIGQVLNQDLGWRAGIIGFVVMAIAMVPAAIHREPQKVMGSQWVRTPTPRTTPNLASRTLPMP